MDVTAMPLRHLRQVVNPTILVLLLCADAAFVLIHIAHTAFSSQNALLSLKTDGGYAEMFQYLKEFWIAIVLLSVFRQTREGIYAAWALLFGYLLCDDALAIHEAVGQVLRSRWDVAALPGLRSQDTGELAFYASVGCVFLASLSYCYRRASAAGTNASKDLVLLLSLFIFFGTGVDMAHIALPVRGLGMLEEGGEMVAMSLIASHVALLLDRQRHVPGRLWQLTVGNLADRFRRRSWATGVRRLPSG